MASSFIHNTFTDIDIHTAKCDICGKNNKHIIKRCTKCGLQTCTPCLIQQGGDGTHTMNSGDTGYAGAVAAKAKAKKQVDHGFLKAKSEKVKKSPSPEGYAKRTRRVRRRRVVIEESEEEEGDITNGEHDAKRPRHELTGRRLSAGSDRESELNDARRGKRPQLRIEEITSPSTEGPSNPVTSASTQFPEPQSPMDFDTSNTDYNMDAATMGGVDALLAMAAGTDSPRRGSNTAPQVRLRGGDVAPGSPTDQTQDSGADFFSSDSHTVVEQHATQYGARYPTLHPPMVLPMDFNPVDFQNYTFTPADIPNYNAFTPAEPTWQNTVSTLFPGQDFNFDNPLWSSAATAFSDRAENFDGDDDAWNTVFYGDNAADAAATAEATASDSRSRTASGGSSKTGIADGEAGKNQGWSIPDEEDSEEGEIKEDGGPAARAGR